MTSSDEGTLLCDLIVYANTPTFGSCDDDDAPEAVHVQLADDAASASGHVKVSSQLWLFVVVV